MPAAWAWEMSRPIVVDLPPPVVPRIARCRGRTDFLSEGIPIVTSGSPISTPRPMSPSGWNAASFSAGAEHMHRAVRKRAEPGRDDATVELLSEQLDLDRGRGSAA